MSEPNEVGSQEGQEEQPQEQEAPRKPSRPSLKGIGNTAIKTTANFTRKLIHTFAMLPLPVKIGLILLIFFVLVVVVVLEAEAAESTSAFTESVNEILSEEENLSDEAKKAFEESGSLIKLPIATLLKMYDHFSTEGDFAGEEIRDNYNYVLGTNEVTMQSGTSSSGDSLAVVDYDTNLSKTQRW